MAISCLPTETSYDVQCPICGHGFLLLTAHTHGMHSGSVRLAARRALAGMHLPKAKPQRVHPDGVFDLPVADMDTALPSPPDIWLGPA